MSRFRSPTSASIRATRAPRRASAVPRFAVVVVLPTPPLPDVMTIARPSAAEEPLSGCSSWVCSTCISACFQRAQEATEESGGVEIGKRYEFAFEPARDLFVDRAQPVALAEHDGL